MCVFSSKQFNYSPHLYQRFFLLGYLVCWLLLATLQENVGTDYLDYIMISQTGADLPRIFGKGEFLSYSIFYFVYINGLDPQLSFLLFSFFTYVGLLVFLFLLPVRYNLLIFALLLLVVTSFFHNQMNGIRQYASMPYMWLAILLFLKRRYFFSVFGLIVAAGFHSMALMAVPLAFSFLLIGIFRFGFVFLFSIFCFIFLLFADLSYLAEWVVNVFFPKYSHYIGGDYSKGLGWKSIAVRLYYFVPIMLVFWLIVLRRNLILDDISEKLIKGGLAISPLFLLYLEFGFFYRVYAFLLVFTLFPLYEIFLKIRTGRCALFLLFVFCFYLLLPYFYKIYFYGVEVYSYSAIL